MRDKLKTFFNKVKDFLRNQKTKRTFTMVVIIIVLLIGLYSCFALCNTYDPSAQTLTVYADEVEQTEFIQDLPYTLNPIMYIHGDESTPLSLYAMPKIQLRYDTNALGYTHFRFYEPYVKDDYIGVSGMPADPIAYEYTTWFSFDSVNSSGDIVFTLDFYYLPLAWTNLIHVSGYTYKPSLVCLSSPVIIDLSSWNFGYYNGQKYLPTSFGFSSIMNDAISINMTSSFTSLSLVQHINFKSSPQITVSYVLFGNYDFPFNVDNYYLTLYNWVETAYQNYHLVVGMFQEYDFLSYADDFSFNVLYRQEPDLIDYYELVGDTASVQQQEFDRGYNKGVQDTTNSLNATYGIELEKAYDRGVEYGKKLNITAAMVEENPELLAILKQQISDEIEEDAYERGKVAGQLATAGASYREGYNDGLREGGHNIFGSLANSVNGLISTPIGEGLTLGTLWSVGVVCIALRALLGVFFGA